MSALCDKCGSPKLMPVGEPPICVKCEFPRKRSTGNRNYTKVSHPDGFTFDSKREAARYEELKVLKQAKIIKNLAVHTKYKLELNDRPLLIRSKGYPNGRKSTWTDDFSYEILENHQWVKVVEDVKGRDTYEERFKRGVFELLTGQTITVVN